MKLIKSITAIMCLLLSVMNGYSQKIGNALAELQKIRTYYSGTGAKHVSGKMTLKNVGDNKVVDKVDFEYWTKGKKIAAIMGYLEILVNDEMYIMVNNKRKTIYGRLLSQLQQKPETGFFDPQLLGKFLNTKSAAATLQTEGEYNTLSMSGFSDSRFSSVKIKYTSNSYNIVSIEAAVAASGDEEQMLLQVLYNNASKENSLVGEEKFSAGKYVEKSASNSYTYTKQYKSYQKL